jgi:site-specific recombinase XerD
MKTRTNFSALLQAFFTDRLMRQRQVSPETIASYRDAFCLLFRFVRQHLNKAPSVLEIEDLDAPLIVAFLCWLENERGNCARTRNARLAAIHPLFKYAALREPTHSWLIQRVLAIPSKRYDRVPVEYLTRPETEALLAAPDQTTWAGRRDRTLMLLTVQTGLRVSELVRLDCQDIVFGNGAHVRCKGKGRKERCTPLRKETVILFSPMHGVAGSAVMVSSTFCVNTCQPQFRIVRRLKISASPRMFFDTLQPWTCFSTA